MPGIQTLGQPGLQTLERDQLSAGPLGRVGNLRFKAEPGATPRASSPNALQRFGQFLSSTVFRATASPEQRAQPAAVRATLSSEPVSAGAGELVTTSSVLELR